MPPKAEKGGDKSVQRQSQEQNKREQKGSTKNEKGRTEQNQ